MKSYKKGDKLVNEENGVYTCTMYEQCMKDIQTGPKTFVEMFNRRLEKQGDKELFGMLEGDSPKYFTTEEVFKKIKKIASFLTEITEERDFIGIYAVNSLEWVLTEYGGYYANCVNVPLYSTFQATALEYVLNETKMKVMFASSLKAKNLFENVLDGKDEIFLKHMIFFDKDPEVVEMYKKLGVVVHFMEDILTKPKELDSEEIESKRLPLPEDTATICYTSGTSGTPKGVILTHQAFSAHVIGYEAMGKYELIPNTGKATYLSYLPLAHVFERICVTAVAATGGRIPFFRGDPKKLQVDFNDAKPNFMAAVPRVLNIFEEKIKGQVDNLNFFKKGLFKLCLWWKKKCVRTGQVKSWLVDKLVFNKVKVKFGGNLEYCLSGGSSINPKTLEYLQAVLCMKIFQGYGLTEGIAANLLQPIDCSLMGTVGIPFPSCKCRLSPVESFPGKNYGELLLAGPPITPGYYKQEDKTAEAIVEIDGERWFKTGDVFKFEDDRFYCVGRVKELFKTSYGEYIVPEHVENNFVGDFIEDIYVTGTLDSDSLCAILVVTNKKWQDEKKVLEFVKTKGLDMAKEGKITKYEIPTAVYITNTPFMELEDGELITPSMKKRRNKLYEHFKTEIESRLEKKL